MLFARRRPDDFDAVIRFQAKTQSTLQLELHWFFAAVAVHALDSRKLHSSAIADISQNFTFNIQEAIDHLGVFFDTQLFMPEYTHVNMLIISKGLTSLVSLFFEQHHPDVFSSINEFCRAKLKIHTKYRAEKRKQVHISSEKQARKNELLIQSRQASTRLLAQNATLSMPDPACPLNSMPCVSCHDLDLPSSDLPALT